MLGLPALVLAALVVPLEIGTGTEVKLNLASLLVPALLVVWLLDMVRRRAGADRAFAAPTGRWLLFLAASLLSLLIGRATWDPTVPVGGNFLLVQLAQWAIFAFSAGAFWLAGNLVKDERWLWRLTAVFLLVGGGLAILRMLPGVGGLAGRFTTIAFIRAPFWVLLTAVAAGQLLFNRDLSCPGAPSWSAVLGASLVYAFVQQQEATSNWVGLAAVLGMLVWLRFPRLRWPVVDRAHRPARAGGAVPQRLSVRRRRCGVDRQRRLAAGADRTCGRGDDAQPDHRAGAGRVPALRQHEAAALPERLLGRHPRSTRTTTTWTCSRTAGCWGWCCSSGSLGNRPAGAARCANATPSGFAAGYVNGMLAAGAGALVIMLFADWILPFVYNIGFPGFQASVLVWLFMGGLVALENMARWPRLKVEVDMDAGPGESVNWN